MNILSLFFGKTASSYISLAIIGGMIIYALVRGKVFLMPFTANRRGNSFGFYLILIFLLFMFGLALKQVIAH